MNQLLLVVIDFNLVAPLGTLCVVCQRVATCCRPAAAAVWLSAAHCCSVTHQSAAAAATAAVAVAAAEPEAVDLLLEVDRLDQLEQHVDDKNFGRTCLYLVSCCAYLPEPEDTQVRLCRLFLLLLVLIIIVID